MADVPKPATAPATVPAKPDAILLPATYAPKGDPNSFMVALKHTFAPIFGSERVIHATMANGCRIVLPFKTGKDYEHPVHNFPIGHVNEGQPRYTWVDRGDGVCYGTKVPEIDDAPPATGHPD